MLLTSKTVRAQTRMILSEPDSPVVQSEEEALWGRAFQSILGHRFIFYRRCLEQWLIW